MVHWRRNVLQIYLLHTSRYCSASGDFSVHQALPELNKAYSGCESLSEDEYRGLGALPEASKALSQSKRGEITIK